MDNFFGSNPGFRSRIAHHIDFPDYADTELVRIAALMLERQGYQLAEEAQDVLGEYIALRRGQPHFANARSIRNALDRARLRQAVRLVEGGGEVAAERLSTIEAADIRASRVFAHPVADREPVQ
jgi:hypothetical protein